MRPKHLKHPFTWNDRKILIQDRVFFVPSCLTSYSEFSFPGWSHTEVFGNDNPVFVEYCSGNGAWITDKAQANCDINWVAVEIRFDRVKKIWSKVKNYKLKNLFVICGEGHHVMSHYFPSASIAKVFINFPDPWPKNRHAKHRIIKPPFIEQIWRVLRYQGELTVVTDDPAYSGLMTQVIRSHPGFDTMYPPPYYTTHIEDYGSSFFDQLWRDKGKTIHYHQYKKRG